jgi:hypothetical protein
MESGKLIQIHAPITRSSKSQHAGPTNELFEAVIDLPGIDSFILMSFKIRRHLMTLLDVDDGSRVAVYNRLGMQATASWYRRCTCLLVGTLWQVSIFSDDPQGLNAVILL